MTVKLSALTLIDGHHHNPTLHSSVASPIFGKLVLFKENEVRDKLFKIRFIRSIRQ